MGNAGNKGNKDEHKIDGLTSTSPLMEAQTLPTTASGIAINASVTSHIMTRKELEKMRKRSDISPDVRIIINRPFSNVDRITDCLYLTGIGGILVENIRELKIGCIINATHEMPLAKFPGVRSLRVPVDDDTNEDIFRYLDDVATVIHHVSKRGARTVVHCMAGASRSSTLVIAYLIKYQDYSLKNAFCFLKSLRPCARPNIGFFEQLITYEQFYRRHPSVKMLSFTKEGTTIRVPDFYQAEFPDLFKVEVQKQLHKSRASQIQLQDSNKNYLNRKRDYKKIHDDVDTMREKDKDDKGTSKDKNRKDRNKEEDKKDK